MPSLLALCLAVMPALQPGVKEYAERPGSFPVGTLPVFHQDLVQCRIGAAEVRAGTPQVWRGDEPSADGIYVAVAGSPLGEKLTARFALDVPREAQGYAIRAERGIVAIVGRDPVGALYGCETFRQMADGGTVAGAVVRDWPDFRYRSNVSLGRGLWNLGDGEGMDRRFELMKRGIDEIVRHKMNLVGDVFRVRPESDDRDFARWRDLFAYMRDRGVRAALYASTAVGTRAQPPAGATVANWPCVLGRRAYNDWYYCWGDDAALKAAANREADFLEKLGATDAILTVHPVDGGGIDDPESWSRRCPKCRARWKDDERWAASANLFNIWCRVFRRRLPQVSLGSCVYPYWISLLRIPSAERDARLRQNAVDYWRKLDGAVTDRDFWFSGWIATAENFREFRTLVPTRPYMYGDTYPQNAGVFGTYHRKLGSMWEPGALRAAISGSDVKAAFEAEFLAAEYAWNRNAPGAEAYDGKLYYDPLADATGPADVMTNALVRICRTFWGADVGPKMVRVLSSGVLPGYIDDPVATVAQWNRLFRDPDYDPTVDHGRKPKAEKPRTFTDTPEFMSAQVKAADACVAALREAQAFADRLPELQRRHLMRYVKAAPLWAARARALSALRDAPRQLASESPEAVAVRLRVARARCAGEYAAAKEPPRELAAFDRLIEALTADCRDARVPAKDAQPKKAAARPKDRRKPVEEVWEGERTVDRPVVVDRKRLVIAPGASVTFRGEGRVVVKYGSLVADGATFVADGVLTNAYRLKVSDGFADLRNCTFRGLRCENPGGRHWFHGGVCLDGGADSHVEGCLFADSDALSFVNQRNATVVGNRFDGCSVGVYFLNGSDGRVTGNVFVGLSNAGVSLSSTVGMDVGSNRFADSFRGLRIYFAKESHVFGNAFEGVQNGAQVWAADGTLLLGNNLKEGCKSPVDARSMKGLLLVRHDAEPEVTRLFDETPEAKAKRLQWWTDARFGMFIHFGLYCLPARGEWIRTRERMSDAHYRRYFERFDPDLLDARRWARQAKAAGMRYAVLTAKHHDGFCLFDSKFTDFKSTKTPFGRDIVREFVDAFRAEGLKVGLYYSLKDWNHPDFTIDDVHPKRPPGKGLSGDYAPDAEYDRLNVGRDMARYRQYMKDQVRELLTNYGRIDVMWFDYSYPHRHDRQGKGRREWDSVGLLRLARSLQPWIVVDDRLDLRDTEDGWDFVSPEAKKVAAWPTRNGRRVPWETCHAFASFFCYHRDETGYKTPFQLLDLLVDSVSKGGNFLLNVSPTGRGEFDARATERLAALGAWMRPNAASVYGCTAAPEGFTAPPCTVLTYDPKRNRLFVHLLTYPYRHLPLDFADKVAYAQFLHDGSEVRLGKNGLELPPDKPNVEIPVVEVFLRPGNALEMAAWR